MQMHGRHPDEAHLFPMLAIDEHALTDGPNAGEFKWSNPWTPAEIAVEPCQFREVDLGARDDKAGVCPESF